MMSSDLKKQCLKRGAVYHPYAAARIGKAAFQACAPTPFPGLLPTKRPNRDRFPPVCSPPLSGYLKAAAQTHHH
ncbi:30S ribosomal protein S1 [Neisseria shayeganii 871]|uniref:30S ribosomal protein S1 n=1 Tax=Neisseria shayeganii 871 TaxID=1032488 RepID=G4CGS5_9NEIS|nr:30S ribosomal protein S1 [Neisseria shayeganii 871]